MHCLRTLDTHTHTHTHILWNNLPHCVRSSHSLVQYKKHIKSLSLIDRLWFHDTMLLLCSIYFKRILHIIFCFSSVSLHCHCYGLYNNCWRLCFRRMSSITFNVCISLTIANLFSLNFVLTSNNWYLFLVIYTLPFDYHLKYFPTHWIHST